MNHTDFAEGFISHVNEKAKYLLEHSSSDPSQMDDLPPLRNSSGKVIAIPEATTGSNSYVDNLSNSVNARYEKTNNGFKGLDKNYYSELNRLVSQILKQKDIADTVSNKFINNTFFEWLVLCYNGSVVDTNTFFLYLLDKINENVSKKEVRIAIAYCSIESPFQVGDVKFEELGQEYFSRLEGHVDADDLHKRENQLTSIRSLKEKYHRVTFASIAIYAEKEKAVETARTDIEKSLILLRLLSPTAFIPQVPSYLGIAGSDEPIISNIIINEENKLPISIQKMEEDVNGKWKITNHVTSALSSPPILAAVRIISSKGQTDFETLIVKCLTLFSENVKSTQMEIKLVYLFVLLESLLLKNRTESIQTSVAYRLAFLIFPQANPQHKENRKNTIKRFKEAYGYRSSFVHHGANDDKVIEIVKDVQSYAVRAIEAILIYSSEWKTKDEFISNLDDRILM